MVRLFRAGEPVKMSKRSGNFVTLADVVEEVGKDVVRFIMLTRRRSEEHTSELQSLMRSSYAVFCLKKKKKDEQRNQLQQSHSSDNIMTSDIRDKNREQ